MSSPPEGGFLNCLEQIGMKKIFESIQPRQERTLMFIVAFMRRTNFQLAISNELFN